MNFEHTSFRLTVSKTAKWEPLFVLFLQFIFEDGFSFHRVIYFLDYQLTVGIIGGLQNEFLAHHVSLTVSKKAKWEPFFFLSCSLLSRMDSNSLE
jgi:hypothetical protein